MLAGAKVVEMDNTSHFIYESGGKFVRLFWDGPDPNAQSLERRQGWGVFNTNEQAFYGTHGDVGDNSTPQSQAFEIMKIRTGGKIIGDGVSFFGRLVFGRVLAGAAGEAAEATGSAASESGAAAEKLVTVSRWGREGLNPGDWVMKGEKTWWSYLRSGKWQPGMGNQFAPFSSGASYQVPTSCLSRPTGWGVDGAVKGLFGQRKYMPR